MRTRLTDKPYLFFLALLLLGLVLLLPACQTLEIRIDRTPTPDATSQAHLAYLMAQGTLAARLAGELELPSTPTPGPSQISGMICYPSGRIPPMTAYFHQIGSGRLFELPILQNQSAYRIDLPPVDYLVFAWMPEYRLAGGYTAAVTCGLREDCSDHSLQPVSLAAGQSVSGVDLCDWYFPFEDLLRDLLLPQPVINPGTGSDR
jgi:hypothetical protein